MISVSELSIRQGNFRLDGVSFHVPVGTYAVLMGKTGSGKTSVLEAICGLRPIHSGCIRLNGVDVTQWPTGARGIGYVPQDGALFPTMQVEDQLAFALRVRRIGQDTTRRRVRQLSEMLEIEHLLKRFPEGLSGGESQRVALGRALAFEPHILLLDEPLSALDDETRQHMYALIRRVKDQTGITALHVTHSPAEAEALGDLSLRLHQGAVINETNSNGAPS